MYFNYNNYLTGNHVEYKLTFDFLRESPKIKKTDDFIAVHPFNFCDALMPPELQS